jgi:hypothetical protein
MARKRSLEIWHIPKRGSIHQLIGALNVLHHFDIDRKSWPGSTRKLFDQKFAIWGFTSKGTSLSKNASETLEALIKYLGLVVIKDRKILITPAGYALLKEFPLREPVRKKRKLGETEKEMGDVHSNLLKLQMLKLILTNPSLSVYCENIRIAPFRETLRMLLDDEIGHLSSEELALFLFHMKSKDERARVKEEILNFRKKNNNKKQNIIRDYLSTPEGNLTLGQAPTAIYWKQLCINTGLCTQPDRNLIIRPEKISEVRRLLKDFGDDIYNFDNDLFLWYDYYCNPTRKEQPVNIPLKLSDTGSAKYLVSVMIGNNLVNGAVIDNKKILNIPVFPKEIYKIQVTDLETGEVIKELAEKFLETKLIDIPLIKKSKQALDKKFFARTINEFINSKDFDDEYTRQLTIIDKTLNRQLLDDKNRAWLRGGRLEFLFYKLLEIIETEGQIKNLKWNGTNDEYGIAHPALGLRKGLPDISFYCGVKTYLLELTTIPSPSGQWGAEGRSVPFHITNFVKHTGIKDVVGIFCVPKVHKQVDDALKNTLIPYKYLIVSVSVTDFIDLLLDEKSSLDAKLEKVLEQQYPSHARI